MVSLTSPTMVFVQKQRCLVVLMILILAFIFMIQFYFIFGSLELIRFELKQLKPKVDDLQKKVEDLQKGSKTAVAAVDGDLSKKMQTALEAFQIDHERLDNMLTINVPPDVKIYFTYSKTVSDKLDALEGDHPDVIAHIRKYMLLPRPAPYFLTHEPAKDWSRGNGPHLLHIFQNKTNGFFIECGAYDGMWLSNTFYLEKLLKWTGVMIEAEPDNFRLARQKGRDVVLVPGCLSLSTKPKLSGFDFGRHVYSKIDITNSEKFSIQVQCVPIYSILLALNVTTVDLFSLDIEGNELDVLKTIPFDKVDIKVLVVEFKYIKEGKKGLEEFMLSKGYVIYPSIPEERTFQKWAEDDHIFIKKGCGYKETRP